MLLYHGLCRLHFSPCTYIGGLTPPHHGISSHESKLFSLHLLTTKIHPKHPTSYHKPRTKHLQIHTWGTRRGSGETSTVLSFFKRRYRKISIKKNDSIHWFLGSRYLYKGDKDFSRSGNTRLQRPIITDVYFIPVACLLPCLVLRERYFCGIPFRSYLL